MNQTSIWIKAWVVNVEETRKSYFESIQQRKKKKKIPPLSPFRPPFLKRSAVRPCQHMGEALKGSCRRAARKPLLSEGMYYYKQSQSPPVWFI